LLGYTYKEIEEETGISHGSIANIVSELEDDDLNIPGTTFDQVNDLRQLSFDLKKSGLKPSQALLGITFLQRLQSLQITPEHLEAWSELVKKLLPPDFPVKEFFESARRLRDLETSQGKSFETITEEYKIHCQRIEKLKGEVDSLSKAKLQLSNEIKPLSSQLDTLKREKERLENDVQIQTTKIQELKSRLKEAEGEKSTLDRETKDLHRRKVKLSSEVEGKDETLRKLGEIGFSDEDLLRLKAFLERMSKDENIDLTKVKEKFFSALGLYKDINGFKRKREAETKGIRELVTEKTILSGEIKELEKRKGTLLGEMDKTIISISQRLRTIGEEATSQVQQQVSSIREQFDSLLADAVKAGQAIGEMQQMVKKGEDSEKSLKNFIREIRGRSEAK
jgi:predicted  nucleic acid-binding Zn-ribbon protein